MAVNVRRHIDFGKNQSPYGYGSKEQIFSQHLPQRDPSLSSASTVTITRGRVSTSSSTTSTTLNQVALPQGVSGTCATLTFAFAANFATGRLLSKISISATTRRVTRIPRPINTTCFGRHAGTESARPAADSRNSIRW